MSWSKKSNSVILNDYLIGQIDKFADLLNFNIVITDGLRTPRQQVLRMYAKLDKTPPEDLRDIYANDNFADEVMDAYPDIEEGIRVVEKYMAFSTPSKHLTGLGFDVRTYDKSNSEINIMIAAAKDLSFKPFLESDHLHISVSDSNSDSKKILLLVPFAIGLLLWTMRK